MSTPLDQLIGVLLHEAHHVLFRHILADQEEYPDAWARTIAEEVSANEFITEPLPGEPIRLEDFPELPRHESTDERYERLRRVQQKKRLPISHLEGSAATEGGNPSAGLGTSRGKAAKGRSMGSAGAVLDDHTVWQEDLQDSERSEAVLKIAVQDALIETGLDKVPDYLRGALCAPGIGSMPGNAESELDGAARGRLPWGLVLRRYVGRELQLQPDFGRPPRRCPELVGVVPGRRRRGARPCIMAVIDTSGSITQSMLEEINGELRRLASDFAVIVVECDVTIHCVYPYRPIRSVHGRGGTSLRPPFNQQFLRKHRPDLLIYFTDGYGPAPTQPPRIPVLWCLTPDGRKPAEWGIEIRMCSATSRGKPRR